MIINTSRFGKVKINKEDIIFMPDGVIGFHDEKRFAVIERVQELPFLWFQAVDSDELAFIIVDPRLFAPDYRPELSKADLKVLKAKDADQVEFYAIVTVPGNPEEMTANLIAPLCINIETRLAKQVILTDPRYGTRHPIIEEMERNLPHVEKQKEKSRSGKEKTIPASGPAAPSDPIEVRAI